MREGRGNPALLYLDKYGMRKFITIVERADAYGGVDLSSFAAFQNSLQKISGDERAKLAAKARELTSDDYPSHYVTLYHGSPHAKEIKSAGFKLTKGKRGGFMGSTYTVDNQGIFLTDSKTLAHFFGSNRADMDPHGLVTCYVDPTNLLFDLKKLPKDALKVGLEICNKWSGASTSRRGFTQDEWWWLLDKPEFVTTLKKAGYTGVVFKETRAVRKEAGAPEASTYFIFDPSSIIVSGHRQMSVEAFYEWLRDGGIDEIEGIGRG